eukprot:m.25472 g.25472  ORF g.25472 m.25472 type:complete len:521 (+) comp8724_c0_seq2:67-1629(+)
MASPHSQHRPGMGDRTRDQRLQFSPSPNPQKYGYVGNSPQRYMGQSTGQGYYKRGATAVSSPAVLRNRHQPQHQSPLSTSNSTGMFRQTYQSGASASYQQSGNQELQDRPTKQSSHLTTAGLGALTLALFGFRSSIIIEIDAVLKNMSASAPIFASELVRSSAATLLVYAALFASVLLLVTSMFPNVFAWLRQPEPVQQPSPVTIEGPMSPMNSSFLQTPRRQIVATPSKTPATQMYTGNGSTTNTPSANTSTFFSPLSDSGFRLVMGAKSALWGGSKDGPLVFHGAKNAVLATKTKSAAAEIQRVKPVELIGKDPRFHVILSEARTHAHTWVVNNVLRELISTPTSKRTSWMCQVLRLCDHKQLLEERIQSLADDLYELELVGSYPADFPSDPEIVLHALTCYYNQFDEGKQSMFSNFGELHVVSSLEKLVEWKQADRSQVCICQLSKNPAMYGIALKQNNKLVICEANKGSHNLFECLAIFAWYVSAEVQGWMEDAGPTAKSLTKVAAPLLRISRKRT